MNNNLFPIRRRSPVFDFFRSVNELSTAETQQQYERAQVGKYLAMTLSVLAQDIAERDTTFPVALNIELRSNHGSYQFDCRVEALSSG